MSADLRGDRTIEPDPHQPWHELQRDDPIHSNDMKHYWMSGWHDDGRTTDVPARTLALYAMPMLGVGTLMALMSVYFLKFATDVLLVAPATIGMIFGLARLWDAVSDPIVGQWSDRTRSRWGRRRPWIAASAAPLAIATVALWCPPATLGLRALELWTIAAVFLFYTAFTAFSIPHLSLGAELSLDHHERSRVYGIRELADKVGLFIALAALFWLESSDAPRSAAPWVAGAIAVWIAFALPASAVALRERTEHAGRAATGARQAWRDVFENPHARRLLAAFFLEQLGFAAVGSLLPFVSEYVLGTPGRTADYMLAFTLPILVTIPIWVKLSRRLGKRRVWMIGLTLKAAGFAIVLFTPASALPLIFFGIAIIGAGHGCSSVIPPSMQADLVDWDELESGERKEGAYFAAWNLSIKAPLGIALMLNGAVLQFAGFEPNIEQTEAVRWTLRGLAAGLPLLWILVAAWLFRRFQFDEADHLAVRRALDARNGVRPSS